ncbi:putative UDP-glycosyltransferase 72B1 [Hypsibius exemplaris]|uniref:UDP-glucuronosyltransferase n=1 Tax=Hypsibius exemplaris TaxID=2072580 RepID=A0A9X6NIZ6_HYPEX|nr:putative UDP-glycosyltransferase 72B1 [Hypsibius exemplaris]
MKHFLVVAIPPYGHLIPLLELARRLAPFHRVTVAVSQGEVPEITRRGLVSQTDSFALFGIEDGYALLDHEKDSFDVVLKKVHALAVPGADALFRAMPIQQAITDTRLHEAPRQGTVTVLDPVDVVIADLFLAAALPVLRERGVPFHLFNAASCNLIYALLHVSEDTPTTEGKRSTFREPFDATGPLKPMPAIQKALWLARRKVVALSEGLIANSAFELEPRVIQALRQHPDMAGRSLHCVGPLFSWGLRESSAEVAKIRAWLDRQPSQSVIYVSFGTMFAPTTEDLQEIVEALKGTGRPFIWSLRSTEHNRLPEHIRGELVEPPDWSDVKGLILEWVPQNLVLQHPSISVFVSHCGWNSTMESVASGVPVIAWPMGVDQRMNALDLVEKGMAVLLEGTSVTTRITVPQDKLREIIDQVAGAGLPEGTANSFREAAETWKEKFRVATSLNGSSHEALLGLVRLYQ